MTHVSDTAFDASRAQDFANRVLRALNDGGALPDGVGRPPHRAVRRDEPACRRRPPTRSPPRPGSTSATCASGSARWSPAGVVEYDAGDRAGTRLPAEHAAIADPRGRRRQHGGVCAVHRPSGRRRRRHRRMLQARRRRAVRQVPALPRGDGRGQRAVRPVVARVAHPAARARPDRAARTGHPRARRRVRSRPHPAPAGDALSQRAGSSAWISPRRRSRTHASAGSRPRQHRVPRSRPERLRSNGGARGVRLHHDVRRHPRSGASR